MNAPAPEALRLIRAWYRLQQATAAFGRHVERTFGVTGEQLALLRIVAERGTWPMKELREHLVMHPATLGQALDRLAARGLVTLRADPADRRRRLVTATAEGRELLARVPPVGPGRLRSVSADPGALARVAAAFEEAVSLFGMERWADDPRD
ncbi:MAG TPA: MarR family transcriptional regulator [Pseudonocardia sp.]|uniref:MarR family winged helix-turn-helix transcriptional regulator n=1 Tax=Pseudonocardia sp. TaxID=60912 RepID=UPI002B4B2B6C|nr:MarR family transcriptional regulator [Pseudonocardia sp.]HLU54837.1 MarR family transcriptional regulator [Pseudonocardia sp.]